jgi:hypothetical protein
MRTNEIGDYFGVNEGTIRKGYSAFLIKGRANRKAKLRQLQWRSAEAGNVAMLIFLGKNELGQSDRQDITTNGESITAIEVTIVKAK